MLLRHEQDCLEGLDVQILCLFAQPITHNKPHRTLDSLALAALANLLHLQEAQILASCGTMDRQQLSCKLVDQHHWETNQKKAFSILFMFQWSSVSALGIVGTFTCYKNRKDKATMWFWLVTRKYGLSYVMPSTFFFWSGNAWCSWINIGSVNEQARILAGL